MTLALPVHSCSCLLLVNSRLPFSAGEAVFSMNRDEPNGGLDVAGRRAGLLLSVMLLLSLNEHPEKYLRIRRDKRVAVHRLVY